MDLAAKLMSGHITAVKASNLDTLFALHRRIPSLHFHSVKRRIECEVEEVIEFLVPVFITVGAMFFISNRSSLIPKLDVAGCSRLGSWCC